MREKLKYYAACVGLLLLIAGGQLHAETTLERVQKKGVLTICADPRNLPYSSSNPETPGIDVEVAQLLAEALGVSLKFHWIDTVRESLLADMLRHHCDCVVGVLIEERAMEETVEIGKRADFSVPYLGTGYVLVTQEGQQTASIKTLDEVKTEKLGTEAGSIAGDMLKQKGYNRRLYPSQIAVLNALQKGQIAYGCLWSNAGWLIKEGPPTYRRDAKSTEQVYADLRLLDGYVPEPGFRWSVSVAVRKGDEDLKSAINSAIHKKLTGEKMKEICSKYHLPYYPPFNQTEQ